MPFNEQDKTTSALLEYVTKLDAQRAAALGESSEYISNWWKAFFEGLGIRSADPKESKTKSESC